MALFGTSPAQCFPTLCLSNELNFTFADKMLGNFAQPHCSCNMSDFFLSTGGKILAHSRYGQLFKSTLSLTFT